MTNATYRIVVEGELDDANVAALPDLTVERGPVTTTLLTRSIDQGGLAGILERLRRLGLVLRSLERHDPVRRGPLQ